MGAFDHLEWTYDEAFEQLFGLRSKGFEQKLSKNSNARGFARGGCLSFDFTDTLLSFITPFTVNSSQLNQSIRTEYFKTNIGSLILLTELFTFTVRLKCQDHDSLKLL